MRKNAEKFEGYVPTDELQFNYCRSSGAGGQHVNKTNTKVEARFHVESAEWIPEEVRQKLLVAEQSRINKDGFLIVTSEKTRVQALNQADVLEKLRKMLFEASQDPRQTTQKDIQILKEREDRSKEANIRFKRERAAKRKYNIRPSDFHL